MYLDLRWIAGRGVVINMDNISSFSHEYSV